MDEMSAGVELEFFSKWGSSACPVSSLGISATNLGYRGYHTFLNLFRWCATVKRFSAPDCNPLGLGRPQDNPAFSRNYQNADQQLFELA